MSEDLSSQPWSINKDDYELQEVIGECVPYMIAGEYIGLCVSRTLICYKTVRESELCVLLLFNVTLQ